MKDWRAKIVDVYLTPEETQKIMEYEVNSRRFHYMGANYEEKFKLYRRQRLSQHLTEAAFTKIKTGSIDHWLNTRLNNEILFRGLHILGCYKNQFVGEKQNMPDEQYGIPTITWLRNYKDHFEWHPERTYIKGFVWWDDLINCDVGIYVHLMGWIEGNNFETKQYGFDGFNVKEGKYFNSWDLKDIKDLLDKKLDKEN